MNKSVIYIATNTINGKIYIGLTIHYKRRIQEHKCYSRDECRKEDKSAFHKAILKYGFENFKFEILEECPPELLDEREIYWISIKNSNNKDIGYNITEGGDKGPTYIGVESPKSILTEEEVVFIREKYGELMLKKDVFDLFCDKYYKINVNTFNDVWHGKTYRNIKHGVYTDENRKAHRKLSLDNRHKKQTIDPLIILDIRNRKNKGELIADIIDIYNGIVGPYTIKDILYYKVYPEIKPTEANNYRKGAKREKGDVYLKIDKETNVIIKEYKSLREAVIELCGEYKKLYAHGIRSCCKNRGGLKSYKGYKWKFKDE